MKKFSKSNYMIKSKNHFTSKADVLKFLKPKLKNLSIENIFDFTVKEWEYNKQDILQKAKNYFKKGKLIIRSSAIDEDSIENSNAGNYESILGIPSNSQVKIRNAINSVIKSYNNKGNFNKNNQILIQTQTTDVQTSGVIFTKTAELAAPYYVINYDEGSSTEGVTKGIANNSVKLFRNTPTSLIPKKWQKLISSIKEIESIFHSDFLDIEFGITKASKIVIFQVRPITSSKNHKPRGLDAKISKLINTNNKKFLHLNNKTHLHGNNTIFSDMSDWNPAEIIGNNPHLLDYSLYDFLIMKKIWHQSRNQIGYQNIDPAPLMVRFGNKPYVDVRASFNSLIPEIIPIHIKKKLMKFYLKKLQKHPFLHDKIEFEILFSCYDFTLNSRFKELEKYGFTKKEIFVIKDSLITFTNTIINNFPHITENYQKSIKLLSKNRYEIISNLKSKSRTHKNLIIAAEALLNDCKRYGTLPFSTMARISFMGSILLKSLPKDQKIPQNLVENFMSSISTPLSEIQHDVGLLSKNKMSKKQFLLKYGHLRPGTYDITASRYDSEEKFFENVKFLRKKHTPRISIDENVLIKILENHRLKFNKIAFLNFVKESIIQREKLKFEFTKNLSDAIELIAEAGKLLKFSRQDLAYLDIKMIFNSKEDSISAIKQKWQKKISHEKNHSELSNLMVLPPIIFSKNDFYFMQYFVSKPNFITSKQISGNVIVLDNFEENAFNLENKIVVIEHADPGYDWIFTRNPLGLITKYGGIASHMSIRCAEVGLPAAIGCGEILYEQILKSSRILLDSKNMQIIILDYSENDAYLEERKVLKSLGYIK